MKIQMIADFKLYQKNPTTGCFKPLVKENLSSLCPGGFAFNIGGKSVPFDWDAGSTDDENGVFHYESGYGPFFNEFELSDCYDEDYKELGIKREDITAKFLASVSKIDEFYVNFVLEGEDDDAGVGDNSDSDAEFIIELLSVGIEDRATGKIFSVKKAVINEFNGVIIPYEKFLDKAYRLYKKDWCECRGYDYKEVQKAYRKDEEYNGEMFVCIDEFQDFEFEDEEYMTSLFPNYSRIRVIE